MSKIKRTPQEEAVDRELISKGRDVIRDFDLKAGIAIQPKKKESKLISIRLPLEMMQALRDMAAKTDDVGYQRIIKRYIKEGLEKTKRSELSNLEAIRQELALLKQQVSDLSAKLQQSQDQRFTLADSPQKPKFVTK